MSLTIITNNTDYKEKIKEPEKTEIWGQFADIEEGFVFQELNVKFFSKSIIKPKPNQIPKPFQKQVPKPFQKLVEKPLEKPVPMQKIETDINDDCNPALNKIIERQIYLGCLICILTIGLFVMP
jgi:hypothetical protein